MTLPAAHRLPSNLTEWERTKTRAALAEAMMLARWVMKPQVLVR